MTDLSKTAEHDLVPVRIAMVLNAAFIICYLKF